MSFIKFERDKPVTVTLAFDEPGAPMGEYQTRSWGCEGDLQFNASKFMIENIENIGAKRGDSITITKTLNTATGHDFFKVDFAEPDEIADANDTEHPAPSTPDKSIKAGAIDPRTHDIHRQVAVKLAVEVYISSGSDPIINEDGANSIILNTDTILSIIERGEDEESGLPF